MATSLPRLGRLGSVKTLLRDGWGKSNSPFVAALCTKADAPPKTPKKAKASSKTLEADERASLLAYKPAVAFPSKLSATGFLPKDVALGQSETAEAVSTATADETTTDSPVAAEEPKIAEVPPTDEATIENKSSTPSEAEVQKDDDDTSSSSSSSSDSDSDSDSDDEKPKSDPPEQTREKAEEKKASGPRVEQVGIADKQARPEAAPSGEAQESAETVTKATPEEVPAPSVKPVGSVETLVDPAPILSSSTTKSIPEVSSESHTVATSDKLVDVAKEIKMAPTEEIVEKEPEVKAEETVKVVPEVTDDACPEEVADTAGKASPEEVAKIVVEASPEEVANIVVEASPEEVANIVVEASPQEVANIAVEASPEGVAPGDAAVKPEGASSKVETGLSAPSEELVDPVPVSADAVEDLAETDVVETPEEQAPEKAPEPEPFDNTTYKNLQHHQYDMYTFSDLDVEMSKYRLPQPSTGRPSPSH